MHKYSTYSKVAINLFSLQVMAMPVHHGATMEKEKKGG